ETGKMSKSKGAILTVTALKQAGYDPLAYRFMCLNSHYRKQLVFSYNALEQAEITLNKLRKRISSLDASGDIQHDKFDLYNVRFKDELSNDLNTANCITVLYDLLKDSEVNGNTKLELIKSFDLVLGVNLINTKQIDNVLEKYILEKIEERNKAKKDKDFKLADMIRDELLEKNIKLIDSREGTKYELI
ncbi:cysteine--tRNA ligase, partial [bacterium]|nr:cysteine--tRNA ligase [bacterium]